MHSVSIYWILFPALVSFIVLPTNAVYNRAIFRDIVRNDHTNDDAVYLNAEQLIKRSGFDYQRYYSIAEDGYITSLLRIINPKVYEMDLKEPPVLLFHGANADQSSYLMSSSIQHFPEVYPHTNIDESIRSSNRSLGFMLANNGYDVWLIGQRGSNRNNMAWIDPLENPEIADQIRNDDYSALESKSLWKFSKSKKYWRYTLDDIIAYEIKNQLDKVLSVTGAEEMNIFAFSLSTPTTMAFLAAHPDYAKRVRTYIQMGPAIAADHFTSFDRVYFERLCPYFPHRGIGFTPFYNLKTFVRKFIIQTSKLTGFRYSLIHKFTTLLFGPSPKYQTNLERNVLAHIFQPVSFRSVQQYCQDSVTKKLTKFDFNKEKNSRLYGSEKPPVYKIDSLPVQNWVIVSGSNDALADPSTVDRLAKTVKTPKPVTQITAIGFNHLDLLSAVEVDRYVNLPILAELDKNSDSRRY